MYHVVCVHYSLIGCYITYVTFVVQTIKLIVILLVRSFSNTTRLKRMPLPFQMNIHKDLSENV